MKDIKRIIGETLNSVKVIDPHCHLRLDKPSADNLADIVLYHHLWIELVSSGMPPYEVTKAGLPHEVADPEMPPFERVHRSLEYLKNIRNSTVGLYLKWILKDLYEVEDDLSEDNLERVFGIVQDRAKDPQWQEEVLTRRCGIEASITVALDGNPYSTKMFKGKEGLLGWLGYYGQQSPMEWLHSLEESFGRQIDSAQDYREYVKQSIEELPIKEYKFIGLFAPAYVTYELVEKEEEITRIIRRIREGEPTNHAEMGRLAYVGITTILETLRNTDLRTIQLITGAEVLPPSRSITHWGESFCGAIGRIAGLHGDFHFNISSASDMYTQDLAILAKHIPNVSVAAYWWHTFYPFYLKKCIETRLEIVPVSKIIGYFSDAYHCEWCYPKLKMVKQILEDILVERVEKGWYSVDTCVDIIRKIFYDNPKRIYGV